MIENIRICSYLKLSQNIIFQSKFLKRFRSCGRSLRRQTTQSLPPPNIFKLSRLDAINVEPSAAVWKKCIIKMLKE
jgi:hypothetical protein